jgi:ApaG protein
MPQYMFDVQVQPEYLPTQSSPMEDSYVFAYTITIMNNGSVAAQLVSRHWEIEDAFGETQVVDGLGVVGHQPLLEPGQAFQYSSSARLHTAMGIMSGYYFCVAVDGHRFEVPVSPFVLNAFPPGTGSH